MDFFISVFGITLRVDLKDGGENGLDCKQVLKGMRDNTHTVTKCPWDNIPANVIQPTKPIIKQRTRSFADLEKLALDGIKKHWSRCNNYSVHINSEKYELYVTPINTTVNSLNELKLIFNTNSSWGRSGNPGVLGKIYYNIGYCNFLDWYEPWFINSWGYLDLIMHKIDEDFQYTSAHELGHTILRKYGGKWFSFTHDGSSSIFQSANGNESYIVQKNNSEINLMHYFKDDPSQSHYDYNLIVASERDTLSLLWLTKIKIK